MREGKFLSHAVATTASAPPRLWPAQTVARHHQVERAGLGQRTQIVEQRQARSGIGQPDDESERPVDPGADLRRRAWLLWVKPWMMLAQPGATGVKG
jgi:hypothetical protein